MSTRRVISERMVIEVDGTRVEGDVERTVRSVDMRIISPYTGLSGGRYCAAFLLIFGDELAGPRGELVAIEILEHLYHVGKRLYENLDMLRQKLADMDAAIEHLDRERFPTEDDFRAVAAGLAGATPCGNPRQQSLPEAAHPGEGATEGTQGGSAADGGGVLRDQLSGAPYHAGSRDLRHPAVAGVNAPFRRPGAATSAAAG